MRDEGTFEDCKWRDEGSAGGGYDGFAATSGIEGDTSNGAEG